MNNVHPSCPQTEWPETPRLQAAAPFPRNVIRVVKSLQQRREAYEENKFFALFPEALHHPLPNTAV